MTTTYPCIYNREASVYLNKIRRITAITNSGLLSRVLIQIIVAQALIISFVTTAMAAEKEQSYKFENKLIKFALHPRTPEQMAAFYEGRGFPKNAVKASKNACFITAGMRNLSKHKIWLNLAQWRFYSTNGDIERMTHQQWKQQWQQLNVPLASQATFSWTLLPEARDLHQHEPVGGNITLTPPTQAFTVEAIFATGEHKKGPPLIIKIENVRCTQSKDTNL